VTTDRSQTSRPLEFLRAEIDRLDGELLELLARRMALVTEVAAEKRSRRMKVKDASRESAILVDRRAKAENLGLSVDIVESLFRLILWASRDQQAALRAEMPLDLQVKTVAVIGGHGGMGRRMSGLFQDLGHEVLVVDLDTELSAIEAARKADVTLLCVPIEATEKVVREVGPHLSKEALLMDVTSIKQVPLAAMLKATEASVLGTHPMFGPGVHSLQGQRIVVCPGRGEAWASWARQTFAARGLIVTQASAEEHDRAMATVQVLTHFQTQVLGLTLARLGAPLAESLKFTSPAYLMELYIAARHFGQDPALYGPIEMMNPLTQTVTATFLGATQHVAELLTTHDQARFAGMFEEVRAFFGEFAREATEQSKFMIDRLVERS
jgi:chorismate mutase/prephenate dehydrogenase